MNSGAASNPFHRPVIKARHDLRNPLAHILGFSEMLAEHAAKLNLADLRTETLAMNAIAEQILAQVNQALDPPRIEAGQSDIPRLQEEIRTLAAQLLSLTESAVRNFGHLKDDVITNDLARIAGAAQKLIELAGSVLPPLHGGPRASSP
jgi:signal transduction histidine kinase